MCERSGLRLKRPESVLVLICAPGGMTLLLERRQPAGFWQSVTGSLKPGESPRMAARRELWEETGFGGDIPLFDLRQQRRFPIVPPWSARYAPGVRHNLEHWFMAWVPSRRMPQLHPSEHLRWHWLPLDAAQKKVFSWTNRDAIRQYCPRWCGNPSGLIRCGSGTIT